MAFLTARLSSYASFRAVQESDKTFQPKGEIQRRIESSAARLRRCINDARHRA